MTYLIWEKQLLGYLRSQSDEDKKQVVDYYREMYYDKIERGESPDSILLGFGDPKNCAAKILMEHVTEEDKTASSPKKEFSIPKSETKATVNYQAKKRMTVGSVVGWFFTTVLLLIPLSAVALSVVVSFAAVGLSGFAMVLGGLIGAVASPFGLFFGWSGALTLGAFGACIATAGVGAILAVIFTLLTKYSAIGLYKAVLILVRGRG